jgi:hypothetical protein
LLLSHNNSVCLENSENLENLENLENPENLENLLIVTLSS